MAATFNESQKIDYLWKKVGYGVTKTAEVTTKEAFNESIASPLLYRGDLVWMQSDQITNTPPASTNTIVQVYKDGVGSFSPSVECTEDLTAPDNQTWKTNLTNWVPTQFGDNYLIQVYVANTGVTNPQTSGTKLFQAGSGSDDTWFFDYQSGVLNFNGATVPSQIASPITGKSVYVVGFRYVGLIGVTNQPSGNISSNTNIGNLNFTDTTISTITTNSNIYLTPNGTGNVQVTSSLFSNGNFTANALSNLGNVGNITITGGSNGYYLQTNGSGNLIWADVPTGSGISNGNSNINIPNINGNINLTSAGNTTMVVVGNGVNIQGYLTITGTLTAGNINANVSSNVVDANSANISGNIFVGDTASIGNIRTDNILYANGSPWDLQEAAGSNTQIQYNDGNTNFGASANFTFDYSTNLLTVTGDINANNANFTGNIVALNTDAGDLLIANIANISDTLYTNNVTINLDLQANTANFNANVQMDNWLYVADTAGVGNLRTDNILYANGSPWDLQQAAGSNTQIQYNDGNTNFGASANFTYDDSTQLLTVIGNSQFNNANLGNLATANYVNLTSNLYVANTANVGSLRTDSLLYANGSTWDLGGSPGGTNTQIQINDDGNFGASANFTFNTSTNLLAVVGTANISTLNADSINTPGNITAGSANLGNLVTANYFHGLFDSTSSSQPNITSVGNLSSLIVGNATSNIVMIDGNINATGAIYANNFNGNFSGTFSGNVDVNGNITIGGTNTQVLFNQIGIINGSNAYTFDYAANILTLTGTGNITGNLNVSSNVTAANGVFGNISTTGTAGDITGANLISTVTLTASGNITAANANLGNTSIANNVIANTFRMGVGVNEFYHSTVYFATTTSTDPNQVLYSTSMANLSAIDFTIISTDETSNTRQTAKITAAVLGTEVVFNEYSGLYINGGVGSFSVNYQAGPPDSVRLVVTPDSSNLTKYNMMIIQYAK